MPEADIVVWVASMPKTMEINMNSLKTPCLMIDGGYPKNLDEKFHGKDIHILKGGIVKFFKDIGWNMMELAEMENPQREMFACFAEAMILEFEKCHTNFSWGETTSLLRKWNLLEQPLKNTASQRLALIHKKTLSCLTIMPRRFLLDFEKPLVELEKQIEQIRELARDSEVDVSQQLLQLETLATRRREEIFKSLTPSQKIQVARHPQRPSTLDFVQMFCDDWIELHGDRNSADDMALIGGIGFINKRPVLLLGHQKVEIRKKMLLEILEWLSQEDIGRP